MLQRFVRRGETDGPRLPGAPAWLSRVLGARGIQDEAAAQAYLNPSFDQIFPPATLPGVPAAAERIRTWRERGLRAAVYGDYDVDGVCASVIMVAALRQAGVDAFPYIPDRHEEGYGLNESAVRALSARCEALVTVDCGVTSVGEVALAREMGMEVIVTDHHHLPEKLPPADTLVSPLLPGSPYPFLCGAGVAWKVAWALCGEAFARSMMDVCALATVADLVPLTGENRALTALGLQACRDTRREGLLALCRVAGLDVKKLTSESVAYQLAPRLNAAGRLESAMDAYRLLTCSEMGESNRLALKLGEMNARRRTEEGRVLLEADAQVQKMDLTALRAIVTVGEDWDSGVVGLAAGRLAEKYAYPAVALTRTGDGRCVGSARSACGVDLYRALSDCGDIFIRFGGHRQAAGMTLTEENVPLLRERLSAAVAEQLGGQAPMAQTEYDADMTLKEATLEAVACMARLEPFGMENPAPRFRFTGLEPVALRAVGADGAHLKCTFRQDGDLRDGIFFRGGAYLRAPEGRMDAVGVPGVNEYQGRRTVQLQVRALALRPETAAENPWRERTSFLQEMCRWTENEFPFTPPPVTGEEPPEGWVQAAQGTLLVCRRMATARALWVKYPHLAFETGDCTDPRAYSAVGVWLGDVSPRFRRVLLCDGSAGAPEAAYWQARCPGAQVRALNGRGAEALMADLRVTLPQLREVYRALRRRGGGGAEDMAAETGLEPIRCLSAFYMLAQMGLISVSETTGAAALLQSRKCEAEDSPLFRLLSGGCGA